MNSALKLTATITFSALAQTSLASVGTFETVRDADPKTTTVNYFVTNLTDNDAILTEISGEEAKPGYSYTVNANETYNVTNIYPSHFIFLLPTVVLKGSYTYQAGDKACEFNYWTKARYYNAADDGIRVHHSGTARSVGEEEADCSTFIHAAEQHYPYNSAIEFTIK